MFGIDRAQELHAPPDLPVYRAGIEDIRLFRMGTMEARQVAKVGYAGMLKGKTTVIPGLFNQLLALSIRFTPRRLVTRISKYLMARA